MNLKKYIAAALAFSAMAATFGCAQEQPEEISEPVVINTGIDPKSVVFDWQTLYENKLNDFKKSDAYSINSMFDLRDINADGIPELIISPDSEPKTVCEVYTYTDGLEKVTDTAVGIVSDTCGEDEFGNFISVKITKLESRIVFGRIVQYITEQIGVYLFLDIRENSPPAFGTVNGVINRFLAKSEFSAESERWMLVVVQLVFIFHKLGKIGIHGSNSFHHFLLISHSVNQFLSVPL